MPLPTGDFKWLTVQEIENFDFERAAAETTRGLVLEVDLDFLEETHDYFSDLPPCLEKITPPNSRQEKLVASLLSKRKYVLHLNNLMQTLALGVKLLEIHRCLSFEQSAWLQTYVNLNVLQRQRVSTKFEQDF